MNFFPLSRCPHVSAVENCDKHVVKIPCEIGQLLSTACHTLGVHKPDYMYKPHNPNNPLNKWVTQSYLNAMWLCEHGVYLSEEYSHRYHKTHASSFVINTCLVNLKEEMFPKIEQDEFYQAMPEYCKREDAVLGYRAYYTYEKSYFTTWKKRPVPEWFEPALSLTIT